MTRRKLLLVAPSAYTLGGVATWLDYLVPGLEAEGWSVTVGLTSGQHHDVPRYLAMHPFERTISIPNGTGTREGRIAHLCQAIQRVAPDLTGFVNLPDTAVAANRLRRSGRLPGRIALLNHGIQPDLFADMRLLKPTLDAVVCTNRAATALAVAFGIDPDRSFYCPYGTYVPATRPERKPIGRVLRLGYVGRFEQDQKHVLDLAPIAAELDRRGILFELVLAGGGPDEQSLLQALGRATASPVHFLGLIPSTEIKERVLDCIDAMLLTSRWETGPLVVWEAMAAGVAVVTSQYVGSGREGSLIHDENCLMFPVGNAQAAADCITRLLSPGVMGAITKNAFRLVTARYSHAASIVGWHRALERILALAPLPAQIDALALDRTVTHPSGRLEYVFGPRYAEILRVMLGRRFSHAEPGGEWPHTLSAVDSRAPEFWHMLAEVDLTAATAPI